MNCIEPSLTQLKFDIKFFDITQAMGRRCHDARMKRARSLLVLWSLPQPKNESAYLIMGTSMTKLFNLAKRFTANEEGAALVEYTVLLGIMMIAVIATVLAVGTWVNTKWTTLNTTLNP